MKFYYRARTKEGNIETGVIEGYTVDDAALLIQKYGLYVVAIEPEESRHRAWYAMQIFRKISDKELAMFFRQLSLMLESKVPVVQSLSSLSLQITKPFFREAITKVTELVEEGLPLSEALGRYPNIFDHFYIHLIKSGELSGKIAEALKAVATHLESEGDIKSEVKKAMIYPIFVMVVLFVSLIIIIKVFMPKLISIIQESGTAPTGTTKTILQFYSFLGSYWWALLIVVIMGLIGGWYFMHTEQGKALYDRLSLKTPFLNNFLKKVFLTRFCSNISTLLIAGISIDRALSVTHTTIDNTVYQAMVVEMNQRVSEGEKMSLVMTRYHEYFPLFVIQMVKVGEETGRIDEVLQEVVVFYEKEIRRSISLFSALLEPIIIVILGLVVTVLAISIISSIYGAVGTV